MLDAGININHVQEEISGREALAKVTVPESSRFPLETIEKFIEFLKDGYKIVRYNEFDGKDYITELVKDDKKEILSSSYPEPFVLGPSDREDSLIKNLEKMKKGLE